MVRQRAGALDEVLADFNKTCELNPELAWALVQRGDALLAQRKTDRAQEDYNLALQRDERWPVAYFGRGFVLDRKKLPNSALDDFRRAIEADARAFPPKAESDFGKMWGGLLLGRPRMTAEVAEHLLETYHGAAPLPAGAVILGYFARRQDRQEAEAAAFLDRWAGKLNDSVWPFPIVQYLQRSISAEALLRQAADDDKATEVRTWLGFEFLLAGQREPAIAHLAWVKASGNNRYAEYSWATRKLRELRTTRANDVKAVKK